MKKICLISMIFIILSSIAFADVPNLINYQGRLTNDSGEVLDTTVSIVFTIYDDSVSGNVWWTENNPSVTTVGGLFNVLLGSINPVPDSTFDGPNRWLGITVGTDSEISPRSRLISVPYSYLAAKADTASFAINIGEEYANWIVVDSVLYTRNYLGIARGGAVNILFGDSSFTHINCGNACTTGTEFTNIPYATISGGFRNRADSSSSTIGGGSFNVVSGMYSTIGGGFHNTVSNYTSTISGGSNNSIQKFRSTIGGGQWNSINAYNATIAGGSVNTINDDLGGGSYYKSIGSAICGGSNNSIGGRNSFIGGGDSNFVLGDYSAILGGYADTIAEPADYSYLFGINSNLTEDSTFMVDMPHIRFGDETDGYEFPESDGDSGQVMMTDGNGQLSWVTLPIIVRNELPHIPWINCGVGVWTNIAQITIDVPTSGKVYLTAKCIQYEATGGAWCMGLGTTPTDGLITFPSYSNPFDLSGHIDGYGEDLDDVVSVESGSHTFYYNLFGSGQYSRDREFYQVSLTATFYPVNYGE